ncbi:MaoC family dehydratase [Sphingobium herbicidovorans NBRC 16415]|uniref:MaoC family dehydratase n=1 Tax=Sphingobium herbicidovorans (strain ATCC 700291 / DSM 11019 / CCUG 56400 / KCTC 2939 / LMG 18315 / NBRC 16415 / MH) TaxID=1219045 RepID=A0A086P6I1_SPHHM|nr:MaoC family dehydratase [Sphingobium herbicidovorans NBRC 16415]
MSGRFFDAWQVGDLVDHPIRRTVTETDNASVTPGAVHKTTFCMPALNTAHSV